MPADFDLAVIGSGFAGSLMAMIARRLGKRVVLIERGRHPRFAIGESATPLANLLLEELARRYDLPRLIPLTKWGTWQREYPRLACGLKRGFTFYNHSLGSAPADPNDRSRQLLVAASPNDAVADTHWYRAEFDQFLVTEAQSIGVEFRDDIRLESIADDGRCLRLRGNDFEATAEFVIDASGPRGFLHRALDLPEIPLEHMPPTQALYTHFAGVERSPVPKGSPPYPPDDAAVHHVFDGGWVWVLRFNNGITSAGVACTDLVANRLRLSDGAPAWTRLLDLLPSVKSLFENARPILPFIHVPRLAFRSGPIVGDRWALLPSAAGFVDPLLSTGFPLTLLGIGRLASVLEAPASTRPEALHAYASDTEAEFLATDRMIAALYAAMKDFVVFSAVALLYFAAASYAEAARRLQKPGARWGFLLHDHPVFGPASAACCRRAMDICARGRADADEREALVREIHRTIEPIDVAGLGKPNRDNWYPADPADLIRSAWKLGATEDQARQLLRRAGLCG